MSFPHLLAVALVRLGVLVGLLALLSLLPWRPALAGYSAQREHDDPGNFGLGLYARGEMTSQIERLGSDLPTLVARITLASAPAAPFDLILTHPIPPLSQTSARRHRSQLAAVAQRIAGLRASSAAPVILAGDLNTAPWSRSFASLLATSGLIDSRAGFGVHGSFPASAPCDLLRISIDHVLVSPDIGVLERRLERDLGSDHLPVLVELQLPRR